MNILAIDVGTTSMRAMLFGDAGDVQMTQAVHTPLIHDGAYIEQSADVYERGLVNLVRAVRARHMVDAISLTAFRSATALVDANGQALTNFIMWQDARNRDLVKRFGREDDFIFKASGAKANTVFTATKTLWFKLNMPDVYARAHKSVIVPDYLIHRMTGRFVTDRTYGSRTHLMNITTLEWDDDLIELFGVDREKLCPLCDQGTVVGHVHKAFAEATGVDEGVPVISAGGDQQSGALGLGVLSAGEAEVNSGTGSNVIALTDRPWLNDSRAIVNVAAIRGMYIVEANVLSSAAALNWLIEQYFPELKGDYDAINRIAEETPPGANGLYCVPHFQGCGARDWNPAATAAFWGLTLGSTRRDMVRALYEGIAAEVAKSFDVLPEAAREASTVYVAGGLSRSNIYNRILSGMLGKRLCRCGNTQATAIGAYVLAAVELGVYPDYRAALNAVYPDGAADVFDPGPGEEAFYRAYKERTERVYRAISAASEVTP